MPEPQLLICEADPCSPEALDLLREAAREARALYPELFPPGSPEPGNVPTPPGGLYLLAWRNGQVVGSGAFRPLEAGWAEVRRMYVLGSMRRLGLAWALLERLQAEALARGYQGLRLETGERQQPAMALYERFGFAPIPPFGPYVGDPTSRCYEKRLSPA